MSTGISVVISCYNGGASLPATLARLKSQRRPGFPWEVIVVDHASTDDGAEMALSCWKEGPADLRVFREPRSRARYSRERGLVEAKYDFVALIDDDSWLAPDWLVLAYEIFKNDSALGAVGSICEPVFEVPVPDWFSEFHRAYGVLTDADLEQCEKPTEHLEGPGLCVRRQAWTQLMQGGFRSLLNGRWGGRPPWSGDTELTLAIRLAGWTLRVEPRMRLQRRMSARDLRWGSFRRLRRRHEASQALLDAYSTHSLAMSMSFKQRLGQLWWCQVGRSLLKLIRRPDAVLAALISDGENRQEVIEVEKWFGRMLGMLRLRGKYRWARRHIRYAPWRLRRREEYLRRPRESRAQS
jgi:glycosyltransferase involved in cell wall biosynthesis